MRTWIAWPVERLGTCCLSFADTLATRAEGRDVGMLFDDMPTTSKELGEQLRRLRTGRSADDVANAVKVSRAQLYRFEAGTRIPDSQVAAALDDQYDSDGWVAHSVARLELDRPWRPWRRPAASRTHAHRWPAAHEGLVWIAFRPLAANVDEEHPIRIAWGPWCRDLALRLPRGALIVSTFKDRDQSGVAVPCRITSSLAVWTSYGLGDLDDGKHIDISTGWYICPAEPRRRNGGREL